MPAPSSLYSIVLARFKAIEPTASFNVSHYAFSLSGTENTTTGIYPPVLASPATIEMIIATKASQAQLTGTGFYVKTDALGLTLTAVNVDDEIVDGNSIHYKVTSQKLHPFGDKTVTYELEMSILPYTI